MGNFGAFLFDSVKDEHTKSWEVFIVEKNIFWTLHNVQMSEISVFWHILSRFSRFKRFEIFRLRQNFVTYSHLTQENIYSSLKQAKSFRSAFHPIKFYRGPLLRVCGIGCWKSNHSLSARVSPWKNPFRHRNAMSWVTSNLASTAPKTAFQSINPIARKRLPLVVAPVRRPPYRRLAWC